jgi:hypothetical protein
VLEATAAVTAREHFAATGDQVQPLYSRPGEQSEGLAHPLPAVAAVAGFEQALLETARARRLDAAAVTRIDSEVNQRPRLL